MRWDVFVSCFFNSFAILCVSSDILQRNYKNKNVLEKIIISIGILGLYIFFSYTLTQNFIRTILLFVIIIGCNIFIDWKSRIVISKDVIVSFLVWILMLLVEIIFTIVVFGIFKINLESFHLKYFENTIANFIIVSIFLLIAKNKYIQQFFRKCTTHYENMGNHHILITTLLSAVAVSLIFYLCYFKFDIFMTFVLCFIVVIIYTFMIYSLFQEKEKSIKAESENEILSKSLNEYEKNVSTSANGKS